MPARTDSNSGTTWSMGAALGAAVAASACCTIPLALVSLGIGGAWIGQLTVLAPYRWLFVTLAVGALGYAGYNEWRLSRRPDCDCETVFSSATRRTLLGVAAIAVLAITVSPWLIGLSPTAASQQARGVASPEQAASPQSTPTSYRQVVLTVKGMTCEACPTTVQNTLEGIDGVYSAETTYEPPEAVVRFDPNTISVEDLTQTTENIGFPSQPKSPS